MTACGSGLANFSSSWATRSSGPATCSGSLAACSSGSATCSSSSAACGSGGATYSSGAVTGAAAAAATARARCAPGTTRATRARPRPAPATKGSIGPPDTVLVILLPTRTNYRYYQHYGFPLLTNLYVNRSNTMLIRTFNFCVGFVVYHRISIKAHFVVGQFMCKWVII